ncbi:MAG TPA: hypothetical protein DCS93_18785 [Microscillaceae bacterium]|nr:hypothetical protein [Microscillaceae bacterium]
MKLQKNERIRIQRKLLSIVVGSLWWLVAGQNAQAQIRPVTTNLVFTPPYTLSLSDYTSISSQKLRVNLQLNDQSNPLVSVKLRFTIQGAGVTIRTSESFLQSNQVQPIMLTSGIPVQLSGLNATLRQYFNPSNLEVLGIDRNQFLRSKRLPSGIYRWQVEVLEARRLIRLNTVQLSAQTIWMVLNQPPIVNIPQNNQKLRATNYGTQNVVFQWLNRSASSPNSAFTIQYNVFLYEIYEPNGPINNPLSAPRNLIYQSTTPLTNTTLIYNNTFPPLTPGKRYIFQVQAQDVLARDLFENNGFSQIVVFQYGDECVKPTRLKASVLNTETIKLSWDANAFQTGYKIRFREAGSNGDWDQVTSQFNDYTLASLKPDTEYEYEVSSICGLLEGQNWASGTARTNAPNKEDFICGVPKGTYDLSNEVPLEMLNEQETFLAGGYQVKVRRATGGNGQFSGVGIAAIPMGRIKAKFKVGFQEVFINADKRMLRGSIYVVRNKWRAMAYAQQQTVDEWKVAEDGKIQILKDGSWTTFTPTDGQDYMLTDAKTGKKVFVDRNGVSDIPLEDRDYSKLTPEEIVQEVAKLKEEADDAIADGRWGDALKLLDKATELAEVIGDKVKKVVGFAKVLANVVKELVEEKKQQKEALAQKLEMERQKVNTEANKIAKVSAQDDGLTKEKDELGTEEVLLDRNEFLGKNPEFKAYLEAIDAYLSQEKGYENNVVTHLILKDLTADTKRLNELANKLETTADEAFNSYKQMKAEGKDETEIRKTIKAKVEAFLNKEVINPTLEKYNLKD